MQRPICSHLVRRLKQLIVFLLLGTMPFGLMAANEQHQVRTRFDVRMPMRDGVHLSADIWMPAAPGRYPVILMRTPYVKANERSHYPEQGVYFANHGYVLAVQDTRGRGDSDGVYNFYFADLEDGYDSIEWLAAQPWSTGQVGMMGVSYVGAVQWMAARTHPPHLACIAPTASGTLDGIFNYQGGALVMGWSIPWLNVVQGRIYQSPNAKGVDWDRVFKHRPLSTMDEAFGRKIPLYQKFLEHPDWDPYWKRIQFGPDVFRQIDIPVLHVTGWFDADQATAMHMWRGMAQYSPAKEKQYLLAGPWTHGQTFRGGETKLGEMEFSGDSVMDHKELHRAFFDHCLKGSKREFDFPRARIYVTGENRWHDFEQYPPTAVRPSKLYLSSSGRANSFLGNGELSWDLPDADQTHDQFTFDPQHPVPSAMNGEDLPYDHRPIERRDDVLVYTSETLDEILTVVGRTWVELYAASDARDTDFTAKILDVYPDGRAIKLGPLPVGVIRARYRNALDQPELLTPGKVEHYRINLFDFAHSFQLGHRVRIEISSSAYPFIAPNQNTGNPVATDTDWKIAHQTIYHDGDYPSHVLLPVLPAH